MRNFFIVMLNALYLMSLPVNAQSIEQVPHSQVFMKLGQRQTNSTEFTSDRHPYVGIDLRILPVSFLNGSLIQTFGLEIGASRQELKPTTQIFTANESDLAMSYWAIKANFCASKDLPVSLCWGIHLNHRRFTGDQDQWAMAGSSQDLVLQFEPAEGWLMQVGKDIGDSYRMKIKGVEVKASDRRYFIALGKTL